MNILITGASGFIGSHLVDALEEAGHHVTVCVRHAKAAQRRWPDIHVIAGDFSRDHDAAHWLPRLEGIDVVINTVGIIRETGQQTFDALHTKAPIALFRACEQAGVKRVIQVSALGADDTAFSQYHLSKRAADEVLMSLNLDWIILLPSIVYGPGAKSMTLFKAIAASPLMPLIDNGDQPVQPIHIDDVCQAVLQLVDPIAPSQLRIEMVGARPITMKDLYTELRRWLGLGHPRFIAIPYRLALLGAHLGGFLGNTPMTREAVAMLRRGNTADVTPFIHQFAFEPMAFEDALKKTPAQQADYWYAGLFFLKPLLRLTIAFVWIFTGIVSVFFFPVEESYAMLARAGITGYWAPIMLYGAATTDVALGLATLLAYRMSLVGTIQIAVIVLYTAIITFSQFEQWLHPFGPVSKNIPLIVATLIMMVLERQR